METKASKEETETVLRLTLKTCPMGVLFEQAHIPVEVTVATVPPIPTESHRPGGAANPASA